MLAGKNKKGDAVAVALKFIISLVGVEIIYDV